jgi:5'-nucleotidase
MTAHLRRALATLASILLLAAPALGRATTITILHVNDTHSHLDAVGPKDANLDGTLGGLAKAATVVATQRATVPNTLFLHAGDLFQGDLFFNATLGVPELQLLAQLGLDAMAVGNHELHLGPATLAGALAQAFPLGGSPLLSANLDLSGFPALSPFIAAKVVKDVGGVKVGLFGLTTPFDPGELPAPVVVESDVGEILKLAAAKAGELRLVDGVDVVICLSHMGFQIDQLLAASVPGLDAVVGGHDHFLFPQPVMVPGPGGKDVPVVQAGEFYEFVGKLGLSVENGVVSVASYELLPVDASVPRFPPFAPALDQVRGLVTAAFGDVFHAPIAHALLDVSKTPGPARCLRDTGVGNLVTDAYRWRTGTDVAIAANGFASEGIPRGPVVGEDAFHVVGDGFDPVALQAQGGPPFLGFPLYRVDLLGAELVAGLEATLAAGTDDVFLQVSGMRYRYDSTRPAGSRVTGVVVNGRPLHPRHVYSATVNLGVVQGLPLLGVKVVRQEALAENEFLTVRDFVQPLRVLAYTSQGRIVDEGTPCR